MKIYFLALLMIFSSLNGFSQLSNINDSLVAEICKTLNANKVGTDTGRIIESFNKHLLPVLLLIDSAQRTDAYERIDLRLQRNCREFKDIYDRLSPHKGDWRRVPSKPKRLINDSVCEEFLPLQSYSYLEESGDTVHVTIKDGFWEDHFKDGSYSKLKLGSMKNCEFEIVFIESNNKLRKNLSYPGDRYRYQILEKFNTYYKLSVQIADRNEFMTFNMYY